MSTAEQDPHPAQACAEGLLAGLIAHGMRDLVLCPGSRSAPFAYAAAAADAAGELRLHVRVDERSAGFLALGLAKRSRRPVAVVTTSGSAVAHLAPAVLEAHHAGVPLVVLTADRPAELQRVGANQATDQVDYFAPAVRLSLTLEAPADPARQGAVWRTTAARLVAAATGALSSSGLAGPVHLDVPFRDPLTPRRASDAMAVDASPDPQRSPVPGRSPVLKHLPDAGRQAVTLPPPPGPGDGQALPLAHDPQTLVVLGELPTPEHRRLALDWADHHGAPVLAEPGPGVAQLLLPHGAAILDAGDWVQEHLPSRVVVVGRPTLGRPVLALTRAPGVRVEVVTPGEPAAAGWADATHEADAVHPFAALVPTGEGHGPSPWARTWIEAGRQVVAALAGTGQVTGPGVAVTVHEALPAGARLLLGSSSVARDLHLAVAHPRADLDVVTSRGLAGIDGLVSTASGLALADPATPTFALLGDLTFVHDGNGLLIGPREPRPDLTVVVVDDEGGSIFATLEHGSAEHATTFDRVFATSVATDVLDLAAAHGARVVEADDLGTLAEAVATPPDGIAVVRVRVDLAGRRALDAARRDAVRQALSG